MPIVAFWLLSGNIRRIRAGNDIRSLMTAAAAQSADGITEYRDKLVLELGDVVKNTEPVIEAERDEAGFAELKQMALAM